MSWELSCPLMRKWLSLTIHSQWIWWIQNLNLRILPQYTGHSVPFNQMECHCIFSTGLVHGWWVWRRMVSAQAGMLRVNFYNSVHSRKLQPRHYNHRMLLFNPFTPQFQRQQVKIANKTNTKRYFGSEQKDYVHKNAFTSSIPGSIIIKA